jgi:pimeloyl-ACP methyl ester carboxylesterase
MASSFGSPLLVSGRPILLLHGHPHTHIVWRKLGPRLAEHFSVVAADLRGYGDSSKPPSGGGHINYSKREMAKDQVSGMRALGPAGSFLWVTTGAAVSRTDWFSITLMPSRTWSCRTEHCLDRANLRAHRQGARDQPD